MVDKQKRGVTIFFKYHVIYTIKNETMGLTDIFKLDLNLLYIKIINITSVYKCQSILKSVV